MITYTNLVEVVPPLADLPADQVRAMLPGPDELDIPTVSLSAAVVELLWDHLDRTSPLSDFIPSLLHPPVPTFDLGAAPPLVQFRIRDNTDLRWQTISALTISQILEWRGTGVTKAKSILAWCVAAAIEEAGRKADGGAEKSPAAQFDRIRQALQLVGGWALAEAGSETLLEALRSCVEGEGLGSGPEDALAALNGVRLEAIVDADSRARFDPLAAADQLLAEFDERETAILQRILTTAPRPTPTLEELGDRFRVTRERIRQVELGVEGKLDALTRRPAYAAVQRRAQELGKLLGAAHPLRDLPPELRSDLRSIRDDLFLALAGPYTIDGDWLIARSLRPLDRMVDAILVGLDDDGVVTIDAMGDALSRAGIARERHRELLDELPKVLVDGEYVLRWTGSLPDKAARILRIEEHPMSAPAISARIPGDHALGTLKNGMSADPRFTRRTKTLWGLSSWAGERYKGIARLMIETLERHAGPMTVRALQNELDDRFDVSRSSVQILCDTSPHFIVEGSSVRLRQEHEVYLPKGAMELTRDCFVVDGVWAFRVRVDHDIVRGSGRQIPEPFAVHLGIRPNSEGRLNAWTGDVTVSWRYQAPGLGSLRAAAESLDATEGDYLFIRRSTPSSLEFRLVDQFELAQADGARRLLLAVGADPDAPDVGRAVSDALGLGGATAADGRSIAARFAARGEPELGELAPSVIQ